MSRALGLFSGLFFACLSAIGQTQTPKQAPPTARPSAGKPRPCLKMTDPEWWLAPGDYYDSLRRLCRSELVELVRGQDLARESETKKIDVLQKKISDLQATSELQDMIIQATKKSAAAGCQDESVRAMWAAAAAQAQAAQAQAEQARIQQQMLDEQRFRPRPPSP